MYGNTSTAAAALLGLLVGIGASAEKAEVLDARKGIEACEVMRPKTESHAMLRLTFTSPPWSGVRDHQRMFAVRGGRVAVEDRVGLRAPAGRLVLADGRLAGEYVEQSGGHSRRVRVDAKVTDDVVSGRAMFGRTRVVVGGSFVTEAELEASNRVPVDRSWPVAQGPLMGGLCAEPTGVRSVNDLEGIRPIWRTEETDIGRGMGNISRFMQGWRDAARIPAGSGCASPLVAEGKLYFRYFVPAPGPEGMPDKPQWKDGGPYGAAGLKVLLERARQEGFTGNDLPEYAKEKVYLTADDVLLCADAATGKTLWKAVVRQRGYNSQHHKYGPYDMSPAYANGRVYSIGMSRRLYAFDAKAGTPLWEVELEGGQHSTQVLAFDDRVVVPGGRGWRCYDGASGKVLWTSGGGSGGVSTPSYWRSADGKPYLVVRSGAGHAPTGIQCLDAGTGKRVWHLDVNVVSRGRGLGPGGITVKDDILLVHQNNGTGQKGAPVIEALGAYRLSPDGAEKMWELNGPIHGECNPVVVQGKYVFTPARWIVDIEDGDVLCKVEKGPVPLNGGYMQAFGDIVLVRVDGTHGSIACGFYKVGADGQARLIGAETATGGTSWHPWIGGGTSSYHHPIYYAAVDGRLFMRQERGVYCWDLRQSAAAATVAGALEMAKDDAAKVAALLVLCRNDTAAVRREAHRRLAMHVALGRSAEPVSDVVARLTMLARKGDEEMLKYAARALGALDVAAMPSLLELAREERVATRRVAMQAAGLAPTKEHETLDRILRLGFEDDVDLVRADAMTAMVRRGVAASAFVPALIAAVDGPSQGEALQSAKTLLQVLPAGELPRPMPRTFESKLVELMSVFPGGEVLVRTLAAIGALGDEKAMSIALQVLEGDDALKKIRAFHLLAALGAKARHTIPLIEATMQKHKRLGSLGNAGRRAIEKIHAGVDR